MQFNPPVVELAGIGPEIALVVAAFVLLIADAILGARLPTIAQPLMASVGLIVAAYLALQQWGETDLQLGGMIALDGFATFCKISLLTFGLLTVWLGRDYLERDGIGESEFYGLVLLSVAGMMLMASAADLIVVFLALETFSLALYVLVGFRRNSLAGQESAMKYFLLGSFSSAFFLLGIALTYGAVGSTGLYGDESTPGIASFLNSSAGADVGLLVAATALLIVGLGFKIAAAPFHMWTPDAYQGAPSPVTGFMAAGSKLAGFAALVRLLDVSLYSLRGEWRPLVAGVAAATMIVGSVLAVVQEDVKRMLAYSSIAHAGFVLTAIVAANDRGVSGALFYLVTYGIAVLGGFGVVAILAGRDEQRVNLVDYKGIFSAHPALSSALTLFMLSLAGVPLTSGFVAKLVVFGPAIDAGYTWLVVVGMITSAIAAFFYLRVLVVMYMQEADEVRPSIPVGRMSASIVALIAVATVVLGLFWSPLIDAAQQATFFFPSS